MISVPNRLNARVSATLDFTDTTSVGSAVIAIVMKRKLEYMNMTNFIAASGMFFSVFYFLILGLDKDLSRNLVLTPIMMSWAALIFYLFIKSE